MRRLIQAFCLVFLFYGFTLAGTDSTVSAVADSAVASTKYLHISTNPSHADVYVNNIKPKHYKEPDYKQGNPALWFPSSAPNMRTRPST